MKFPEPHVLDHYAKSSALNEETVRFFMLRLIGRLGPRYGLLDPAQ